MGNEFEELMQEATEAPKSVDELRHKEVLVYKTRTIKSGSMTEIECFPIYKRAYRGHKAQARKMFTTDVQQRLNDQNSFKRMLRKVECNFTSADYALTLTYGGDAPEMEKAKKDFKNFINRLNRVRVKQGLEKAKYVACLEAGTKNGRAHHHVIISGGISRDEIEQIWGLGYANCDRLQPCGDGLKALVKYMTKTAGTKAREKGKKLWTCSRGLKMSKVTISERKVSKRDAARIAMDAENDGRQVMQKKFPGKAILEISVKRSEYIAGAYIYVRMYDGGAGGGKKYA